MGSRRLAKALCAFLPGCAYAGRGKESFQGLCGKAYSAGQEILCVIFEKHGSPSMLSLARVAPTREGVDFEYLPEAIIIRNLKFHPALKQALGMRKAQPAQVEGEGAEGLLGIFGISMGSMGGEGSQLRISCSAGRLGFYMKGAPCMELEYHVSRHAPVEGGAVE